VIENNLLEKPRGATHGSTRSMAKAVGMNRTTINRTWNAFGLQSNRARPFKLSTALFFVERVRDAVDLYLDPPERAVVLCVDEKSQIQAFSRLQPVLPIDVAGLTPEAPELRLRPPRHHQPVRCARHAQRQDHGVAQAAAPRQRVQEAIGLDRRRRAERSRRAPNPRQLCLLQTPDIQRWLLRYPRVHLHFTPASGFWPNMVERWFGELYSPRR